MKLLPIKAYVLGYLSGMSEMLHTYAKDTDPLKTVDAFSAFGWIDNYCRANPLERLYTASENLFGELWQRDMNATALNPAKKK